MGKNKNHSMKKNIAAALQSDRTEVEKSNEPIVTKQQERAKFAFNELTSENIDITKEFANFIVGTPTMLLSNGLGQTMAFLMAKMNNKDDKKFVFVFNVVKKYLRKYYSKDFPSDNTENNKDFMMKFLNINDFYKQVEMQNDVLKMLEWLKRYARAFENGK